MDIAEVARRGGVPASTLRYYEEIGLIESTGRAGLRRQFAPEVLIRLALIKWGKTAGFSLTEIAGMFGPSGRPALSRGDVHAKADALEKQIRELTAVRDMLRHVAECRAPSHMECPSFRAILNDALTSPG